MVEDGVLLNSYSSQFRAIFRLLLNSYIDFFILICLQ